jgi:hypothetical protein
LFIYPMSVTAVYVMKLILYAFLNVVADRSWLRVGAREGIVTIMLHPAGGAP